MIGLFALGALFLAACALSEPSRRREPPQEPPPPPPEWIGRADEAPEIARRCCIDLEIAALAAEMDAQRHIVDRYCNHDDSPYRQPAKGTLFMSRRARAFTDLRGPEPCVYVEMEWGAVQCIGANGPSTLITNPALNIQ